MRKMFPGYYRPTKEEFFKMWEEATFAFDTNILLNTYRYTAETQKKIFEILEQLKDRIWLPYQVAFEYHERRLDVISEQVKVYEDIETLLDRCLQQLESLRPFYFDIGQIALFISVAID